MENNYFQIVRPASGTQTLTLEEFKQFYPNFSCIDDSHIQYVVNSEDQQFTHSQLIIAQDPNLSNSENSHVIVEPTHIVGYQNTEALQQRRTHVQGFTVNEERNSENFRNVQQVYYATQEAPSEPVVLHQGQQPQPQQRVVHHIAQQSRAQPAGQPQQTLQLAQNILVPHQTVLVQHQNQQQLVQQQQNHIIQQQRQQQQQNMHQSSPRARISYEQPNTVAYKPNTNISQQQQATVVYKQQKSNVVLQQQPPAQQQPVQPQQKQVVEHAQLQQQPQVLTEPQKIRAVDNAAVVSQQLVAAAAQQRRVPAEVIANHQQQRLNNQQVTPHSPQQQQQQQRMLMAGAQLQRHIVIQTAAAAGQPVQHVICQQQQNANAASPTAVTRLVTPVNNGNRFRATLPMQQHRTVTQQQVRPQQPMAVICQSNADKQHSGQVLIQIKQQPRKIPERQFNDLDDLEDSITAAVLQKAPSNNQPIINQQQNYEMNDGVKQGGGFQQRLVAQDQKQGFVEQQNNFEQNPYSQQHIREFNNTQQHQIKKVPSPRVNNKTRGSPRNRQTINKRNITQQQQLLMRQTNHINKQDGNCDITENQATQSQVMQQEQPRDSARMLVMLQSGEQRLITFTLPKETCAVQDLLDQVGIPFSPNTNIQCVSNPGTDIDYIVTVGQIEQRAPLDKTNNGNECTNNKNHNQQRQVQHCRPDSTNSPDKSPEKSKSPEPPKEIPPRYVEGMLAICKFCGYTGVDFNRCQRCKRKFTEEPKSIPHTPVCNNNSKKEVKEMKAIKLSAPKDTKCIKDNPLKRARKLKKPEPEPEVLTLSSDEESQDELLEYCGMEMEGPSRAFFKEPVMSEDMEKGLEVSARRDLIEIGASGIQYTVLECRTVRIGSFKYSPTERIIFSTKGIRISAPTVDDPHKKEVLHIQHREIVKILVHFGKVLPIIFIYALPSCTKYIREKLNMLDVQNGLYFDSCAKEETYKRITLLPSVLPDEVRTVLINIYGKPNVILDELSARDANEILNRTCPRDRFTTDGGLSSQPNEIRQILIYPPGKGGISINTEDYGSLAQDQFLNDVIIDFYLKYLCKEVLSEELRNKTHVFSSFFYKRLTTKVEKASRLDNADKLTAAQKRHNRVKNWTKNVNIFEKDFIVIPINESSHWFLAIVCYPGLKGPHTILGNKPIDYKDLNSRKMKDKIVSSNEMMICSTTITPVNKSSSAASKNMYGEEERDEAEGSDSDLEQSNSESEIEEPISTLSKSECIKQPCILIFDSLSGAISRQRVVATLRDYLTCEYQSRTGTQEAFNKSTMRGGCPKVPQQNNFTDCGLYLLQYVEQFFKVPITDYRLPIKELKNWFEEIVVTRKREEISDLIKTLVADCNPDNLPLPDIPFPTLNGKLVEVEMPDITEDYDEQFTELEEMEEEEEMCEEEEMLEGDISLSQDSENGVNMDDSRHPLMSNSIKRGINDSESESDSISPVQRRLKLSDGETYNGISEFKI